MNRRGRLLSTVTTLFALLALLASCSSGGGGGRDQLGGDGVADAGPGDVPDEDVPPPEDVPQADVPADAAIEPDVPGPDVQPDVRETCVDTGCDHVTLEPCETVECNVETGDCDVSRTPAPGCCLNDEECPEGFECPTVGGECVFRCEVEADCLDAFTDLNLCEHATCNTDSGVCERVRTEAPDCCLNVVECGEGFTCVPGQPCQPIEDCSDQGTQALADQWCVDNELPAGTCKAYTCDFGSGQCNVVSVQGDGCCLTVADCDDGIDCNEDSCPVIGGACNHTRCECTENFAPWEATFDSGTLDDFQLIDWDETDAVTWQPVLDEGRAYSGYSLYLGDPSCGWYFNGDEVDDDCTTPYDPLEDDVHARQVKLELISPDVYLENPNDPERNPLAWMIGFWISGESQPPDPLLPPELPQPDTLVVSIEDLTAGTGDLTPIFRSSDYNNNIANPIYVSADLSAYTNRAIRIHFDFDTFGADNNRYPGYWLDDVRVRTFCGPIQCEQNSDCNDGIGCTQDVCTLFENGGGGDGVCAWNVVPFDCVSCDPRLNDVDCDSGDECVIGTCREVTPTSGVCEFEQSGAGDCCDESDVVAASFDGGALPAGWSVEDDGSDVLWQVVSDPEEGITSLYFGDPELETYNNGGLAFGRVSTGVVDLPDPEVTPYLHLVASWQLQLSTEFDIVPWDASTETDRLTLYVVYEDGAETVEEPVWSSVAVEGSTMGAWLSQGVDLSPYAGRSVELVFEFNSGDEFANDHGGAWIDDFSVRTICTDVCLRDADCDDADACTVDTCEALQCNNAFAYADCCENVADCRPGNACTDVTCTGVGVNPQFPGAGTCTYRDDNDAQTCCDADGGVASLNEVPVEDLATAGYVIVEGDHGDDANTVVWHASELCALSPPYGLYFGDDLFESYQTGYTVSGSVTTPTINVPSSGGQAKSWLEFDLLLDTEWAGAQLEGWENPPPGDPRDELRLYAVQGVNETFLWSSFELDFRGSTCPPNESCDWATVRVDMTTLQGQSPKLKWVFDSIDDISNAGMGACIDDIRIVTDCSGAQDIDCFRSEECDDDNECTFDFCQADLACTHPPTGDPNCCALQTLVSYTWDTGTDAGWTFADPVGTVGWSVADFTTADSGSFFLYFGNPEADPPSYDAPGLNVGGDAFSPAIQLPANVEDMTLTFAYYLDVEDYDPTFPTRDRFEVRLIDNISGEESLLADKQNIPEANIGAQPPTWFTYEAEIPVTFAGALVTFEIAFDSGDAEENTGLGVLIDTFVVDAVVCP